MEKTLNKSDKIWIKLMKYGRRLGCHQMAERSFFINKYQFPVCARCTGVLIGYILSPLLMLVNSYRIQIAILLCSIMFIDWFIQYLNIKKSNNIRRLITGIFGGMGIIHVYIYICQIIISYL